MVININILKKAISKLPAPKFDGERCRIELPDRVQELNSKRIITDPGRAEEPARQSLTLTAITICRSQNECWHEWVIEI